MRGKSSPVVSRSNRLLKLFHPLVGRWCHTIVTSYGGGLVDGDRPWLSVVCGPDTRLYLTSPGFTHVFKGTAEQHLQADLRGDAVLVCHNPPLVPHADSKLRQRSHFRLEAESSLVVIDWLLPGRTARGEHFDYEELELELRIECDRQLLLLDRISSRPGQQDPCSPA
ncbi:MAG: urease accessory protein UreD, partial [Candidatus Eremiobacteraeota bacterium]|nr:urease accessory protein UreD [Candidatus Eremiobacteraeota bacterium]